MKKIAIFGTFAIVLLACIGFTACNNKSDVVPEEPETYTVHLGWSGEINVLYEPMATRATTDDLYGIQVYAVPESTQIKYDWDWKNYAYGLFDDPSNITVTLQSGYKYKFVATVVKDGKNILYKSKEKYYSPFHACLDNKFYYDGTYEMDELVYGRAKLKSDSETYACPNIERFYGELSDYIPSESNTKAKINMKRTAFGAKFIVGGKLAVDGKLEIQIFGAPKIELELTPGDDEIFDIFSFENVDKAWAKDDYTASLNVTFKRISADGTESPMGNNKITFKRNTTTIVEFNMNKDGNDKGIDLDIPDSETGDLAEGSTVTIDGGEVVDTEVEID